MSNTDGDVHWSGSEIAIIGMAGRFPGAPNVEKFWTNLRDGVESITYFTDQELLATGVDPAALQNPAYVKANFIIDSMDQFDAAFFGFSPRLAAGMDPQRRLFLECAREVIEAAGYHPEGYDGAISVFAGSTLSSYMFNNLCANPEALTAESFYLNQPDSLATMVGFKLNLRGACYNVGAFCATSLVSVHMACQSLLSFECDMALAGGVHAHSPHKAGYFYEEGAVYSPDGHCRPFDAQAQGVVFGSGLGLVVLKRLKDALADGDPIDAVILGSATNNDGSQKVSYFAPSVTGQAEVIVEALAVAGVEPDTISFVEAHGTGTALGDPVEVAALNRAFQGGKRKKGTCALGSLKGNVSHLDSASGICGLIKTVLALKHRQIPPTVNFHEPNPNIDFDSGPFFVNSTLMEWKSDGAPRRAGVSSFGFGGTNAHVVLQEAPVPEPSGPSRPHQLLVLSAKTSSALEAATGNMVAFLKSHPDTNLADAAYTLKVGRSGFNHRRIVVCREIEDAVAALEMAASSRNATAHQDRRDPGITFMFSGQGSQYANMGAELYRTEREFRETVDRCAQLLQPHLGLDIRQILYTNDPGVEQATQKLNQTSITQPALFVTEYAIAKLWMSWGIHPTDMVGHSIGEYVAACLASVYSLEDALSLVAARGRLMQSLPGGSMLAVRLRESEIRPLIDDQGLCLAAINSPSLCTVSGSETSIESLKQRLSEKGIEYRPLHTSHAFHSSMMDPILEAFQERVRSTQRNPPQIPFLSNLSGTWITPEQAMSPEYWTKHLRHAVRFSDGVQELLKESNRVFLEVGPGNTLSTLVRQHVNGPGSSRVVISSLRHPQEKESDDAFILKSLGQLWLAGVDVNWSGFYEGESRSRVVLPTYPYERRRHWIDPTIPPQGHWAMRAGLTREQRLLPNAAQSEIPEQELAPRDADLRSEYVAPQTDVEQILANVWRDFFGIDKVGIHDSFFDLGGDSLSAMRMISRIRSLFHTDLPPNTLFVAPTIDKLAAYVTALTAKESQPGPGRIDDLIVPLQKGSSSRPPLFMVHSYHLYTDLPRALGSAQPFYGVEEFATSDPVENWDLESMMSRYVRAIRSVEPHGPYFIGGFCSAAILAFEVARQLEEAGESVPLLVIIDFPGITKNSQVPKTPSGRLRSAAQSTGAFWRFHIGKLKSMPAIGMLGYAGNLAVSKLRNFMTNRKIWFWRRIVRFYLWRGFTIPTVLRRKAISGIRVVTMEAMRGYSPKPYQGDIAIFLAKDTNLGLETDVSTWRDATSGNLQVIWLPGDHFSAFAEPNLTVFAQELGNALDSSMTKHQQTTPGEIPSASAI
jgi:phthiocerol/phenolphthiocerol synthesis type-I polyketide synthase E